MGFARDRFGVWLDIASCKQGGRARLSQVYWPETNDRVEVAGLARYPSHTTGRAVFRIRRLDNPVLILG
ncbi:hypothetical protein D3C76_1388130 [compost metagenome]